MVRVQQQLPTSRLFRDQSSTPRLSRTVSILESRRRAALYTSFPGVHARGRPATAVVIIHRPRPPPSHPASQSRWHGPGWRHATVDSCYRSRSSTANHRTYTAAVRFSIFASIPFLPLIKTDARYHGSVSSIVLHRFQRYHFNRLFFFRPNIVHYRLRLFPFVFYYYLFWKLWVVDCSPVKPTRKQVNGAYLRRQYYWCPFFVQYHVDLQT